MPTNAPARPNIVVFLTDDLAYWTLGAYGNAAAATPSADLLARTGARFDRAFTPCPVCSPARASFWTGLFPSGHGVHDWLEEREDGGGLPGISALDTIASRLSASGYATALCGKWHASPPTPPAPGFDVWFTQATGTNARFGPQTFYEGRERVSFHGHPAGFIGDRAVRFLRERDRDRPFFLCVGLVDPHTPHQGQPARLTSRLANHDFPEVPDEPFLPIHGTRRWTPPSARTNPEERRRQLADYYGAASSVDEQLGRVLDELDNQGAASSTLVVYTSDHGHCNGQHGIATKGNGTIPVNFVDEAIRVPLLIRWPGVVRPGAEVAAPVDHCDLHAAILEAAGVSPSPGQVGRSLLPLASENSPADWREYQICEYGNSRMIRSERWKLVRRHPGPNGLFPDALYDLASDPRETTNVIDSPAAHPVLEELDRLVDEFFARHTVPGRSGLEMQNLRRSNAQSPWNLPAA